MHKYKYRKYYQPCGNLVGYGDVENEREMVI